MIRPKSLNDLPVSERDRLICSVLPEIDCPPECSLCCEFPLEILWDLQLETGATEIRESNYGSFCRQYKASRCLIFDQRPFVCRIFWKEKNNPVCHGGRSANHILTEEEFRRILWCWMNGTLQDARALVATTKRGDDHGTENRG